jgi:hypothetical protein
MNDLALEALGEMLAMEIVRRALQAPDPVGFAEELLREGRDRLIAAARRQDNPANEREVLRWHNEMAKAAIGHLRRALLDGPGGLASH